MPSRTLHRGDIVLVPFPFTDLSAAKVRPAVVVSPVQEGPDVIIAFISSTISKSAATDIVITPEDAAFSETGLHRASTFRMAKLLTIERSLIQRWLGRVSPEFQAKLDKGLGLALGLVISKPRD